MQIGGDAAARQKQMQRSPGAGHSRERHQAVAKGRIAEPGVKDIAAQADDERPQSHGNQIDEKQIEARHSGPALDAGEGLHAREQGAEHDVVAEQWHGIEQQSEIRASSRKGEEQEGYAEEQGCTRYPHVPTRIPGARDEPVAEQSAQDRARQSHRAHEQGKTAPDLKARHRVCPHEVRRNPYGGPEGAQAMQSARDGNMAQAWSAYERTQRGEKARWVRSCRSGELTLTSLGLSHRDQSPGRDEQSRYPEQQESRTPADRVVDESTRRIGEHIAYRDIGVEKSHRQSAHARREIVAHHGLRGRRAPGFADPHTHSGQEQRAESGAEAAQRSHAAPQGQRGHDQIAPVEPVGEPGDGQPDGGVKQAEGNASQQPELRIRELEIVLDRLEQDGKQLPVHPAEDAHDRENGEYVVAIKRCTALMQARGRRHCHRVEHRDSLCVCRPGAFQGPGRVDGNTARQELSIEVRESSFTHESQSRDLRRRAEAVGDSPIPRAAADIHPQGIQAMQARRERLLEAHEEVPGPELTAVCMPR